MSQAFPPSSRSRSRRLPAAIAIVALTAALVAILAGVATAATETPTGFWQPTTVLSLKLTTTTLCFIAIAAALGANISALFALTPHAAQIVPITLYLAALLVLGLPEHVAARTAALATSANAWLKRCVKSLLLFGAIWILSFDLSMKTKDCNRQLPGKILLPEPGGEALFALPEKILLPPCEN